MAFTQSDLDKLDSAIASGTLSVEFNGRRVQYQRFDQLIAARKYVAEQLGVGVDSTSVNRGAYKVTFRTHRGC